MGLMYQDPENDNYTFDQEGMLSARADWLFAKRSAGKLPLTFSDRMWRWGLFDGNLDELTIYFKIKISRRYNKWV
jgi:nuclear transport factor 2 (NTF2) superfamily protein